MNNMYNLFFAQKKDMEVYVYQILYIYFYPPKAVHREENKSYDRSQLIYLKQETQKIRYK